MLRLFSRAWPTPPKMSRSQYRWYRIKLLAVLLIWIGISLLLFHFWESFPIVLKGIFIILGYIFIFDIGMIEQIFVSYEKYLKEGL